VFTGCGGAAATDVVRVSARVRTSDGTAMGVRGTSIR
jgi:hypothetical protein